nr:FtsX-like permease family protein [Microbacterium bovistercoris]
MTARRIGGFRIAVRAATTAPFASLLVVVVVALVALAGSIAPALLERTGTETVRAALGHAPAETLDPTATARGTAVPGPGSGQFGLDPALADVWGGPLTAAQRIQTSLPPPLRTVVGDAQVFVATDPAVTLPVDGPAVPSNSVQLALDPGLAARVRIVEGTLPTVGTDAADDDAEQATPVALSREAAQTLDWAVGAQRRIGGPDGRLLTLTGTFEARDPDDPAWRHEPTGLAPGIAQSQMGDIIHLAMAYAPAELLTGMAAEADGASTTVWFPLLVDRITGENAATVAAQLRGLAGENQSFAVNAGNQFYTGLVMRSAAPDLLDDGAARVRALNAVVLLVAIAPLGVAVVVVGMTGTMLAARRAASVRLARARGASTARLAALLGVEGLILGVVGAAVGAGVSRTWSPAAMAVCVLVALTPAVVLAIEAPAAASRTARADLGGADRPHRRRRLQVEAAVVLPALAVLVLAATRIGTPGIDPVLVAAPLALVALASVLALRLVPPLVGLLEAALARGRGLMALLGPAQARRGATVRVAPVLAAVVCVAIALFAAVFTATVAAGVTATARGQVGADVNLTATGIDAAAQDRLRALDGVDAIAPVYADPRVVASLPGHWVSVTVYAIDPAELARVQQGVPGALPLPAALSEPSGSAGGDAVPAVFSDVLAGEVGDATLTIQDIPIDRVATTSTVPFGADARWIAVDRDRAAPLIGPDHTTHTVLLRLDADADTAAVAGAARQIAGAGAATVTPAQVEQGLEADPALQAMRTALVAALAAAAILLVCAIAMTLLRTAGVRGRMLGLLAAVGYPRRRALPLVVWELAPPLLVALVVGLAAGFALPPLLIPAVDLTPFVGGSIQPAPVVQGWMPGAVALGFVLVGALAVLIAAAIAARATASATLRRVDEEVGT